MHIVSWNLNGLPTTAKEASYHHGSLHKYFAEVLKADIVCFQEAKVREDKLEKWLACVPGYESFWAFSQNKKGYSGVVTYVKEAFSPVAAVADCLPNGGGTGDDDITREGRVILTDHGCFVLLNVYAPNAGEKPERPRLEFKMKFLNALRSKCDELVAQGRHVIVVGDLNVSHQHADIAPCFPLHKVYAPEELAWADAFLSEYVDAWRHLHPGKTDGFTCWNQKKSARLFNEGARIDFTLCDRGLLPHLVAAQILDTPDKWSDHAGISLTLKEQSPPPAHPPVALSSKRMKQFQEDKGQSKLTAMFLKRKQKDKSKEEQATDASAGRASEDVLEKEATETRPFVEKEAAEKDPREEQGNSAQRFVQSREASNRGVQVKQDEWQGKVASAGPSTVKRDEVTNIGATEDPASSGVRVEANPGTHADASAAGEEKVDGASPQDAEQRPSLPFISDPPETSKIVGVCAKENSVDTGTEEKNKHDRNIGSNAKQDQSQNCEAPTNTVLRVSPRPLRKSTSGKKRGRNGNTTVEGSETRTQLKLHKFFAKETR